jgi:Zn-dependent peptidase ImmA (M78 family)
MSEERDLSIPEIEEAFLRFVELFHSEHQYESNFVSLAKELKIRIRPSKTGLNEAFTLDGQRVILMDFSVSPQRQRFTGWHELSHHLFDIAEGGSLKAFLRDCTYDQPDSCIAWEERFCFKAAALLLMPTPSLKKVQDRYGYSPLSVLELSNLTGASVQASLRRVIWNYSIDVHAVLIDSNGYVLDSLAHGAKRGRFSVGFDFQIKSDHPLTQGGFKIDHEKRFEAVVPFKRSTKPWKSKVIATQASQNERILAFFLDAYPAESPGQGCLF